MKNSHTLNIAIAFSTIVLFTLNACDSVDFQEGRKPRRVILPAGEVREGWYFAGGDQVVIDGTVNGDAYVAGGIVEVNGTINGDLIVAGGQVTVSGKVSDDVRAAGGSLRFGGKVGKNITAAGGSITFGRTAEIGGNVLAAGGSIQLGGSVMRSVRIAAGDMAVTGSVGGNVHFIGGSLSVLDGSGISGNLIATMDDTTLADIASGTVAGKVELKKSIGKPERTTLDLHQFYFWFKVIWAVSLLATGLAFILVLPKQFSQFGTNIQRFPGKSLLWGIVALIASPIVTTLLCFTVVGIPLALFTTAAVLWLIYLSQLVLGIVVAQRLLRFKQGTWWGMFWKFAVGLAIIQVLTFVPYLRTVVIVAGLIFGMGTIVMTLRDEVKGFRKA